MRIIAGTSKGKKILQPKDQLTRPLKDLTKESIFNIIMHSNKFETKIEGSNILDLFSGVGSFGLECLSRGALHAVFVESYKEVLDILKKNIENLNYIDTIFLQIIAQYSGLLDPATETEDNPPSPQFDDPEGILNNVENSNKEKLKENTRKYRNSNKEKFKEIHKIYRNSNKEKLKEFHKKY